jgi:hypothetical protein
MTTTTAMTIENLLEFAKSFSVRFVLVVSNLSVVKVVGGSSYPVQRRHHQTNFVQQRPQLFSVASSAPSTPNEKRRTEKRIDCFLSHNQTYLSCIIFAFATKH